MITNTRSIKIWLCDFAHEQVLLSGKACIWVGHFCVEPCILLSDRVLLCGLLNRWIGEIYELGPLDSRHIPLLWVWVVLGTNWLGYELSYVHVVLGRVAVSTCSVYELSWVRVVLCAVCRRQLGPRFNIKMSSYQYRKSHCGDQTILRPSYLHSGISYTSKTASLYWIRPWVVQLSAMYSRGLHLLGYIFFRVMACGPKTPSHCLNQNWIIIKWVLWYSSESHFIGIDQDIESKQEFENYSFKIISRSPSGQWVNWKYLVQSTSLTSP